MHHMRERGMNGHPYLHTYEHTILIQWWDGMIAASGSQLRQDPHIYINMRLSACHPLHNRLRW